MLGKLWEVFIVALKLGVISFGGPMAHLGSFRREYVERRKWLDEVRYAELVALGQFLPGPSSSQTGMAIGMTRAGIGGAVVTWVGFTLPSALLMVGFALVLKQSSIDFSVVIRGMEIVAVAIVAQAILGMGTKLLTGKRQIALALLTVLALAVFPSPLTQILVLAGAGLLGLVLFRDQVVTPRSHAESRRRVILAWLCLGLFFGLLAVTPWFAGTGSATLVSLGDAFYRVGSLVFGGGHVVLPLLKQEVVAPGWVAPDTFMAGYGFAQAIPGPMFSVSAYLGFQIAGWPGAAVALVAIFLPSLLLVVGVLPFWNRLRQLASVNAAVVAVNAAVVGLLVSAFYDPIGKLAIRGPVDFGWALVLFALLEVWKFPTWAIVIVGVAGVLGLHALGF